MVQSVTSTIDLMVNPFEIESDYLVSITSEVMATKEVEKNLLYAYRKGNEAVASFMKQRLNGKIVELISPKSKLKLKTFRDLFYTMTTKVNSELKELK